MKKSGTCITKRNPQTVKGRGTGEDDIGLRFGKDLTNLYKANAPKGCNKKQGLKTSPPASLKASKTRGQKRAINSKVVVSKACRSKQQSYKAGLFSVDKVNLQIPALASVVHHDIAEYLIRSEEQPRNRNGLKIEWNGRKTEILFIQEMQKKFDLRDETYFMAINMMDRYRAQGGKEDGERVLIACVKLASKYEEIYVKETDLLIDIVSRDITEKEIRDLELEVLHRLDFSVRQCCHLTLVERMRLLFQLDIYFSQFCIYLLKVMQINSGLAFANQAYLTIGVGVRVAERCYNVREATKLIESFAISPQLLRPIALKAESALKTLLYRPGCQMRQLAMGKLGSYLLSAMEKKFQC